MEKNCPFTGHVCLKQDCMIWMKFEEPSMPGTKDMCGIEKLILDVRRLRIKADE